MDAIAQRLAEHPVTFRTENLEKLTVLARITKLQDRIPPGCRRSWGWDLDEHDRGGHAVALLESQAPT